MKLESQVVSLYLAKRLKELGVKQESLFYWIPTSLGYQLGSSISTDCDEDKNLYLETIKQNIPDKIYSAFTSAELGEILPPMFNGSTLEILKGHNFGDINSVYCVRYYNAGLIGDPDKNMADAMAKMLIHILENKLIEVPK